MTYIETVPEANAPAEVAEIYETDRESFGRLPNFTPAFSHRPELYKAWRQLNGAIKERMDLRRYELATLAAARSLQSSYCALQHGSVLAHQILDPDTVRAIATDHRAAGLDEVDVAVMDLAEKVVDDATRISQVDIDGLRSLGLADEEIFDVVAAAAARCFFSKTLDALGVEPDSSYNESLDAELREALTVGRPIEI